MNEIVVISGKGGTGKTSITAALAYKMAGDAVIADCDVDAANLHLLMDPVTEHKEYFRSGQLAVLDSELCISCDLCREKCRFNAIDVHQNIYRISEINCEGCGYCARICPVNAISMLDQTVGEVYISKTRINTPIIHARLYTGAENSGKLVADVKTKAKKLATEREFDYLLVDGSPGIGCPVISSLSGADYAILVTEPTVSGLHDLKRVYELVKRFEISCGCIINKADLNPGVTKKIRQFLDKNNIEWIADLPYDDTFTLSLREGKTIMESKNEDLKKSIENSLNKIKQITIKN